MTDYRPIGAETPESRSRNEAPYPFSGSSRPLIFAFSTLDGLNTITLRGRMGTSTPVLGLRPTRSPLERTTNEPKPDSLTVSPRAAASQISSRTDWTSSAELRARQSDLLINDFRQIGASHGLSRFAANPNVRHIEPHSISPYRAMSALDRAGPQRAPANMSEPYRIPLLSPGDP